MREWVEEQDEWPEPKVLHTNGDRREGEHSPAREAKPQSRAGRPPRVDAAAGAGVDARLRGRVFLGIRDLMLHQEVLDHLERDARIDVVGAVTHPEFLFQRLRELVPDVIVACPSMTREMMHPAVGPLNLMVVAEEMTVPVLRDAIEAGAGAVFAWPEERDELSREISAVPRRSSEALGPHGQVIAVYGARGGSGTTFIASQLAASFADLGQQCVLVDLDTNFADVTIALGIDQQVRTIADLVPVVGELGPDHVEDALFRHPRGFSVLLAPPEPAQRDALPSGLYKAAIALLAGGYEVVVVHVPRGLDGLVRTAIGMADEVVLVVAPDLFSLYAARRAVQALGLDDRPGRCRVLVNPVLRGEIRLRDVEGVLGIPPSAAVRFDTAVPRAQAQGRLLPPRARRAGKDLRALAGKLTGTREVGPPDRVVS